MIDEDDDDGDTGGDAIQEISTDDRYSGVRSLWLKVIIRAIFDWVTYRDSTKLLQRKLAENAEEWLFKPSLLFNSFENVSRYLDIDPDVIRIRAKKMSRDDVAKIEHLERLNTVGPKPERLGYRALSLHGENERVSNEGV